MDGNDVTLASKRSKKKDEYREAIYKLIEKTTGREPIIFAIPRIYIDYTGSVKTALLLSQVVHWAQRGKRRDGYFYKTLEEWKAETGLSQFDVKKAMDFLADEKGVLERKRMLANGSRVWHYRLRKAEFMESLGLFIKDKIEQEAEAQIQISGEDERFIDTEKMLASTFEKCGLVAAKSAAPITKETAERTTKETTNPPNAASSGEGTMDSTRELDSKGEEDIKAISDRILQIIKTFNPIIPRNNNQSKALRQLAQHVLDGELALNTIAFCVEADMKDLHYVPILPDTVLRHVGRVDIPVDFWWYNEHSQHPELYEVECDFYDDDAGWETGENGQPQLSAYGEAKCIHVLRVLYHQHHFIQHYDRSDFQEKGLKFVRHRLAQASLTGGRDEWLGFIEEVLFAFIDKVMEATQAGE